MPARRETRTRAETYTQFQSRTRDWLERARAFARDTGLALLLRSMHEEAPQPYRIVRCPPAIPPGHEIILGLIVDTSGALLEVPGPAVRHWGSQSVILPPAGEEFIEDIDRGEQGQDEQSAEAELAEEPDVEGAGEFDDGDLLPPYVPMVLPEYSDVVDPPPAYSRGSLARTGNGDDRGSGPFKTRTAHTLAMQAIDDRKQRYGDQWFRNYCMKLSDRALLIHEQAIRQEDAMEFTENMDTHHYREASERATYQRQMFAQASQTRGTERDSSQIPTTNVPKILIRDFQVPPTCNEQVTPARNVQAPSTRNVPAQPTGNVPATSTRNVPMPRWVLQDRLVFGSGDESPDEDSGTDSGEERVAQRRRARERTTSRSTHTSRMNRMRNQFARLRIRQTETRQTETTGDPQR